jgi:hypothetical protein
MTIRFRTPRAFVTNVDCLRNCVLYCAIVTEGNPLLYALCVIGCYTICTE